jgi:hypothetical protein
MNDYYEIKDIDVLISLLIKMKNHEFSTYEFQRVLIELDKILISQRELREAMIRYRGLSRP